MPKDCCDYLIAHYLWQKTTMVEATVEAQTNIPNLWQDLANLSPLIAALILGILGLATVVVILWRENKTLQKYIRENDRENLKVLNALSTAMDKVKDNNQNSDKIFTQELKSLKEFISLKLDNNGGK